MVRTGYLPTWTAEEIGLLYEMAGEHRSHAQIAAALGRSECGVRIKCKRLGITLTKFAGMTANRLARWLGVPCAKTVSWWCNEGWLRCHDTGIRVHSGWVRVVEMEDLLAFLEDERHWHLWEPERITDAGMREWASEMRAGVRFLTTGEVGDRLGLTCAAVNDRIHRGLMRGVKRGSNWLVREEDAVYVAPGSRKGLPRPKPLTAEECALVRRLWGRYSVTEISLRLGRKGYSKAVYNAARRTGLPMFGKKARKAA